MLGLAPRACPSYSSPPTATLRPVLQVCRPILAPDGYGLRPQDTSYLPPLGSVSPVTWHQCRGTSVEPKPEQDIESLVPRRTQPIGQAFVDFSCRVSSST